MGIRRLWGGVLDEEAELVFWRGVGEGSCAREVNSWKFKDSNGVVKIKRAGICQKVYKYISILEYTYGVVSALAVLL